MQEENLIEQQAESIDNSENFEENLEDKISENKLEKAEKNEQKLPDKYTVDIPAGTKLEQIHALKDFLSGESAGTIQIFILLS